MTFWLAIGVLVVGSVSASLYIKTLPGKYDALAQCLSEKGVKFYGAVWCSSCKEQKRLFGNSAELLPFVECYETDQKTMNSLCMEKKIKKHPAWDFPDGSRLTGVQLPKVLAEKAGCPMPQ